MSVVLEVGRAAAARPGADGRGRDHRQGLRRRRRRVQRRRRSSRSRSRCATSRSAPSAPSGRLPILRHAPRRRGRRAAARARGRLLPGAARRAAVHAPPAPGEPVVNVGTLELISAVAVRRRRLPARLRRRWSTLIHQLARLVEEARRAVKLVFALAAATLFGTGAYLLLQPRPRPRRARRRADLAGGGADAHRLGPHPRRARRSTR